jgi:hypothetical protein
VPDTLSLDILIPFLDGVGMEQVEEAFPEVVEEVGLSVVDAAGGGELDLLAIPLMPQPIHNMLLILQPTVSPLQRRKRNSCRRSLLPWRKN